MDSVQTCFVALKVPTTNSECHVTVGMNHAASTEDVTRMKTEFAQLIRPYFPIDMEICNYNPRGPGNDMPAYDVRFKDSAVQKVVEGYYRRHYRQKQGCRMFPLHNPHISVDDERSLADVEQLICQRQGRFQVTEFIINVRPVRSSLSAPSALPPIQNQSQWLCSECGVSNSVNVKECATATCSQWRPLDMMPKKTGDWMCCGTVQFASRSACFKCGRAKNGSPYKPQLQQQNEGRQADWICPQCGDQQFARNSKCRMCGCYQSKATQFIPK